MRNMKTWKVAGIALVAAIAALVAFRSLGWSMFGGPYNALKIDLAQPDAWIRTQSLARLPRDLLRVPLAKDVLSEDFVFYYEQNADRLGLQGSLRRIAYEHDLDWEDRLLRSVLDEPAQVALWRDARGSLRHYLIAITRNQMAKLVQGAAAVALKDRQLKVAGTLHVGLDSVTVFALDYAPRHTLLFASRGERAVILSDPGMLLNDKGRFNGKSEQVLRTLLGDKEQDKSLYARYFQAEEGSQPHSLVISTHFLSFGYQHFFPGFEALRFDFSSDGKWSTQVLLDAAHLAKGSLNDDPLWKALPVNPSACALLPVEWQLGKAVVAKAPRAKEFETLLAQLDGPAAVCWYQQSHLHTPLFVAQLKASARIDGKSFDQIYNWAIRAPRQDGAAPEPIRAVQHKGGAQLWQRPVNGPFGIRAGDDGADYLPTLARQGRYLVFSPDDKLVEQALAALNRRYPNMGDVLPGQAVTLGVIVPKMVSEMAAAEAFEVLPADQEAIFRNAAEQHLLPRLAAMKKYPAYSLTLAREPSGDKRQWQTVEWQVLGRK